MQRLPVQSSDLVSVGYDNSARILEIEFREARVYQYYEVPANIYDGLIQAKSPGSFFASYVSAYFRYRRVQAAEQANPDDGCRIAFASTNPRKLRDMRTACSMFGIQVDQLKLEIDEIQAPDPLKIAQHKADTAFKLAKRPVVTNDSFISIPALNGFPGGYMKDVIEWLTSEDFLSLMASKDDKRICFSDILIYHDGKRPKTFKRDVWGVFIAEERGRGSSLERVVVVEGNQETIAQHHNRGVPSVKPEDDVWFEFAQWFAKQQDKK